MSPAPPRSRLDGSKPIPVEEPPPRLGAYHSLFGGATGVPVIALDDVHAPNGDTAAAGFSAFFHGAHSAFSLRANAEADTADDHTDTRRGGPFLILHRFVVKPTGLDRSAGLQRRIDLPNDIQRAARFGRSDRGPASRRGTEHRHCYIDVTCPVALQLVDQLLLLGDVLFGLRDMVIRLGWMLMTIGHRRFSLPNPRPRAFTAGPWGYSIESSDGTERGKDRGENSAIRRPSDAGYGIAAGTGKR
jgi:hypothetical protein